MTDLSFFYGPFEDKPCIFQVCQLSCCHRLPNHAGHILSIQMRWEWHITNRGAKCHGFMQEILKNYFKVNIFLLHTHFGLLVVKNWFFSSNWLIACFLFQRKIIINIYLYTGSKANIKNGYTRPITRTFLIKPFFYRRCWRTTPSFPLVCSWPSSGSSPTKKFQKLKTKLSTRLPLSSRFRTNRSECSSSYICIIAFST